MTSTRRLGWTTLALLALVGCESPTTPGSAPSTITPADKSSKDAPEVKSLPLEPGKTDDAKKDPMKSAGATDSKFTDAEMAEIKKLSPEDQAIAIAQVTCPVSHQTLGMEVPIKKVIDGKTFFICCPGCEKKVAEKPQEVLAELKK